ncbi:MULTISPECIES: ABC transporter ATP-binding protein [Pasteurellaceae]|uniref:ABC transporter ATP-binding protein n=1 Tax=Pasteurella atlantica TaxID=2827233 RepID=A0AAW8CP35_9PAST|nr:ABC transporter ATP-binding protein [Pasteurella atlantica]MBR0573257.1 ABC transporter ATP-binding protein [Pasteurella atlantica]MDP8039127.1 ABC transporter ATP-binding protein [Pasteurella atlantica]MDP8041274.1 ABC transporter ATP-binding protein [Pasteurella atlantica]MDP8043411.1 ABC transporter ATP-binding protein [Pasteurella atlantica]MDP8045497.1 ABC transporter ATP-binding protein [Pasteurella atlantica]
MIKFFQNHFALSETGAKDLRTAIFWRTLLNLSMMLPVVLTFTFLQDYLGLLKSETLPSYGILFYLIFALCAFLVMYSLAYIDYEKCYTKIYNESADRRIKLAETLRQLPMAFFGKKDTADLSSLIMEDATQIEMLFSHAVPQIFAAAISMSVMGLSMFFYDWRMSLAIFWVVPVGFLVFYLSKQKMQRNHDVIYAQRLLISEQIQNGMDMVQEIKSYNQETHYLDTLNQTLDEYENKLINLELLGGALLNISYSMLKLGLPSVIIIGAWLFSQDTISLFTYLVFLILVGRIYDPFIDVMNHFALLLYLNVRIKRMKEMDAMPRQTGNKTFNPTHFDIEFKAVNFSYQTGMKTLQDVSFVAKQGEVTALIGPSGGGKSTVAKLAARFWDIDSGEILLGGQNISEIEPEVLLAHFAIVFQDVALFNSTIMENIRLGRKDATDEEVKEAARIAQCVEFIERLPQGYDTLIGENGEKLSGGERQRISIARALLKDAPVILLDEATASLDARNESKIQQAISALIKNKTVLIIAHRMRTVVNADKIVTIKAGQVVETGTPEILKTQNGVFSMMLKAQNN